VAIQGLRTGCNSVTSGGNLNKFQFLDFLNSLIFGFKGGRLKECPRFAWPGDKGVVKPSLSVMLQRTSAELKLKWTNGLALVLFFYFLFFFLLKKKIPLISVKLT
jgi:hypothetical protein